jgi:hypothetical protein
VLAVIDWLDPIHGVGYQWWSGFGGALVAPALIGLVIYVTPTRCSQLGCRRRAIAVSEAGAPFCRKHIPDKILDSVDG